jgi:hypothetical protein
MIRTAWEKGYKDAKSGRPSTNPYSPGSEDYRWYVKGYTDGLKG